MSDQDIRQVSALTGTFAALKPVQESVQTGNASTNSGKNLPSADKPDFEKIAREMNIASQSIGRDLRFQVNMESGHSVIEVLDRETGEIIRQIPPEKLKSYVSDQGDMALRLFDDEI